MLQEIRRSVTLHQETTNMLHNCLAAKVESLTRVEARNAEQNNQLIFDSYLLNLVTRMTEAERTQLVFLEMLQRTLQDLLVEAKV